jgi:Recombination endonuclease VII
MAQSKDEKALAAKRARAWKLYRISLEEQDEVEAFQQDSEHSILLSRGNLNDATPALLFTDHDHITGLFRGRLAYLINKGLGTIENSYKERTSAVLRALADYLDNPPAVAVIGKRFGLIGRAQVKKSMVYGSENGPIKAPKKVRVKK